MEQLRWEELSRRVTSTTESRPSGWLLRPTDKRKGEPMPTLLIASMGATAPKKRSMCLSYVLPSNARRGGEAVN